MDHLDQILGSVGSDSYNTVADSPLSIHIGLEEGELPNHGTENNADDYSSSYNNNSYQIRDVDALSITGSAHDDGDRPQSRRMDTRYHKGDVDDPSDDHDINNKHEDILVQLTENNKKCLGQEVSKPIAGLVKSVFVREFIPPSSSKMNMSLPDEAYAQTTIVKKFTELPYPANVAEFIKPAEVNDAVSRAVFRDEKVRKVHAEALKAENGLSKAVVANIHALQALIELKTKKPQGSELTKSVDEIIRKISLSMEISGLVKHNIAQSRKLCLTNTLNPQFRSIAEGASDAGKLFGTDLDTRVSGIETTQKLCTKLRSSTMERGYQQSFSGGGHQFHGPPRRAYRTHTYRGRGHVRGRGDYRSPYHHQQQYHQQRRFHHSQESNPRGSSKPSSTR